MRHLALAALVASTLAACTIDRAVGGGMRLSPALAADCANHCRTLGMRLAAVVVVANSGGCVCEPSDGTASGPSGAAAVAGGVVVQQSQQQAQQQQQPSPTPPRH